MPSYPYAALAVIRYKSPPGSTDGVSFAKGERVTVITAADDDGDWLRGTNEAGVEGVFPAQFVEEVEEELKVEEEQVAVVVPLEAPVDEAQAETPSSTISTPAAEPAPTPVPAAIASPPTLSTAPLPTPTRAPSLPSPTAAPEAPKKPSSLRDRIAALNAAGAGAAPPPLPRAKPSFARKPIPVPALAPAPIASSPAIVSPVVPEANVEKGGDKGAMSAEDAKASIGKGGSLKDRIAALQGLKIDSALPPPPGRAPKVWKRKEEPVVAAEEVTVDATPASPSAADETPAPPADSSSPAFDPVSPAVEAVEASPAQTEEHPDPEATKRAALTARMAGLGGQRVGMAMPALPKKAGPPRRKAAAAPVSVVAEPEAVVEPESVEVVESAEVAPSSELAEVEEKGIDQEKNAVEEDAVKEVVEEQEVEEPIVDDVVHATEDDSSEAPSASTPVDEPTPILSTTNALRERTDIPTTSDDDFDTPALPPASDDFDSPSLPPSPLPRPISPAFDAHQSPPPPPKSRLAVPAPTIESDDDDDDRGRSLSPPLIAPVPVSPKRPVSLSRPPVPQELVVDVAAAKAVDEGAPTSPSLSGRPKIPQIPMSFHENQRVVEKEEVVVPRAVEGEEESEEEERQVEEQEEEQVEEEEEEVSPVVRAPPPVRKVTIPVEAEAEEKAEEEEQEDPEVKRRAALAKRMAGESFLCVLVGARLMRLCAALGGMNMRMGPMMPPIGGLRKTTKKEEPVESPKEVDEGAFSCEGLSAEIFADEIAAEEKASLPPPRRAGTIPAGGMLLPGIMPGAPPPEPEPESETEVEAEVEEEEPAALEAEEEIEYEEEEEVAPPPLPAGRPSTGPPRRSIPIPTPQAEGDDEDVPPPLPAGRHTFVSEPETFGEEEEEAASNDDDDDAESDMDVPPPLPPTRQLPTSPLLPPTTLPPSSPPSRRPPVPQSSKRDSTSSFASLGRRNTDRRSTSDGGLLGVAIPRASMDMDPEAPDSPVGVAPALPPKTQEEGGNFKARDVDLAKASQWWRAAPFAPPMSIRGRKDAVVDCSESSATKRGKTRHDNE